MADKNRLHLTYENDGNSFVELRELTNQELDFYLETRANRFFQENPSEKLFAVCVIDFINQVSNIYEYECERTIKISCTAY